NDEFPEKPPFFEPYYGPHDEPYYRPHDELYYGPHDEPYYGPHDEPYYGLHDELHYEASDNVSSVGSNSRVTSTFSEDQPCITKKKIKLTYSNHRQQYAKTSWVWKYFILSQDKKYDVCTVEIMNLNNKKVKCDHKLIHDGSTGNMSHHLHSKHNLHESHNK
ncbi:619_t:CDS:1, partial [Scutellospora calospora]